MQPRLVVELLEVDAPCAVRPAVIENRSRRAVRLIGDREIERWGAVMRLSLGHPSQRVVGAEHDPGRAAVAVQRTGYLSRVRRDGTLQLRDPDVLVLVAPAGRRIGAHDEALEPARGLAQPLAPRLGDECDGRGDEEDALSLLDQLFSDAQGRECLAGAARHDEATPVVAGEPGHRVLDGLGLQGPGFLHRPLSVPFFNLNVEVLPEVDLLHRGMGVLDGALRVRPPPTGGHDPAQPEDLVLRAAKERVDPGFPEDVTVVVALALDGDPLARRAPRDEIDADVAAVASGQGLALGPVGPAPDAVELERRVLECDAHEQLLEPAALLRFVAALGPDAFEDGACGRSPPEVEARLCCSHGVSEPGRCRDCRRRRVPTGAPEPASGRGRPAAAGDRPVGPCSRTCAARS